MKPIFPVAGALALLAACHGSVDLQSDAGTGSGAGTTGSTTQGTGGASVGSGSTGATGGGSSSTSAGNGGAGVGGGSTTDGGTTCPGLGDACTACISAACPATFCACTKSSECLALLACLNNCAGNQACVQTCETAHPNGISDVYLVSGCAGSSCPSQCPGNAPINPCTKCTLETCPDAMNACIADPECVALSQCLTGCGNANLVCQQGCYAQHGAGTVKLQAVVQCQSTSCSMVCK
jgi:hypothetical protein